jgi:amino acid transporter
MSGSTFVSDFTGFLALGWGFAVALVIGLAVVLPAALAAADLAVCHPRAGGIYQFTRSVWRGAGGRRAALAVSLGFFGTFLVGAAGETIAGAHVLREWCGGGPSVRWYAAALVLMAVAANLRGVRSTTWVSGALLAVMLGVRGWLGLAGFAGWAETGAWSAANLVPVGGAWQWTGAGGLLAGGVAFGFWSFVGIEGAAGLVEETRNPRRALPRGLGWGLAAILVTTLVMGIGSLGTQPLAAWHAVVGADGADAPHLRVGAAMFGAPGRTLLAVASLAATASTLLIALAAVPRMIFAIARDGLFFGAASRFFAARDPATGVPVRATLLVGGLLLGVTLGSGAVVECLQAAAYLWFFRYYIVVALALVNRVRRPGARGALPRGALIGVALAGGALIASAWSLGFVGRHLRLGGMALLLAGAAGGLAFVAYAWRIRPGMRTRTRTPDQRGPAGRTSATMSSEKSGAASGRRLSLAVAPTSVISRPEAGSIQSTS